MTRGQATTELFFAGILWGFGFVAAVWALRDFTPIEVMVYRFLVASLLGEFIYLLFRGANFRSAKNDLIKALPGGFFLGMLLLFQTIGLKYTSATKSGFITSLYVITVPLLNTFFFKSKSHWYNYAFALLALGGTFMLIDAQFSDINVGDVWTLACSLMAAFHIIYIGHISNKIDNAFRFNNFQSLWILIIVSPLLLTQDKVNYMSNDWQVWMGVLSLGIGSSIVAFYLQIRAQKILSDSTASMLFLLESPFAALFGFLLLNERLNGLQTLGAAVILLASMGQVLSESAQTK